MSLEERLEGSRVAQEPALEHVFVRVVGIYGANFSFPKSTKHHSVL